MRLLTAFDVIVARGLIDVREDAPRHEDSSAQKLLRETAESARLRSMTNAPPALPDDIDALRALIVAERAAHAAVVAERNTIAVERDLLSVRTEKLEQIVAEMQRARFGRSSEKIDDDQFKLAFEALETEHAKVEAEAEKADPRLKAERTKQRRRSRNENLDHLPHEEVVIEPESKLCPCCNGALHVMGEDVSRRLWPFAAASQGMKSRAPTVSWTRGSSRPSAPRSTVWRAPRHPTVRLSARASVGSIGNTR